MKSQRGPNCVKYTAQIGFMSNLLFRDIYSLIFFLDVAGSPCLLMLGIKAGLDGIATPKLLFLGLNLLASFLEFSCFRLSAKLFRLFHQDQAVVLDIAFIALWRE